VIVEVRPQVKERRARLRYETESGENCLSTVDLAVVVKQHVRDVAPVARLRPRLRSTDLGEREAG